MMPPRTTPPDRDQLRAKSVGRKGLRPNKLTLESLDTSALPPSIALAYPSPTTEQGLSRVGASVRGLGFTVVEATASRIVGERGIIPDFEVKRQDDRKYWGGAAVGVAVLIAGVGSLVVSIETSWNLNPEIPFLGVIGGPVLVLYMMVALASNGWYWSDLVVVSRTTIGPSGANLGRLADSDSPDTSIVVVARVLTHDWNQRHGPSGRNIVTALPDPTLDLVKSAIQTVFEGSERLA